MQKLIGLIAGWAVLLSGAFLMIHLVKVQDKTASEIAAFRQEMRVNISQQGFAYGESGISFYSEGQKTTTLYFSDDAFQDSAHKLMIKTKLRPLIVFNISSKEWIISFQPE